MKREHSKVKQLKIIHFLQLLSQKELSSFKKYLSSPYFNNRQGLLQLLQVLKEAFLQKSSPGDISKEAIYARLYGDRPYNEPSLRAQFSQLSKLLLDFFAQQEYSRDKLAQHRFLLKYLNRKGEQKYFSTFYSKAISLIEKTDRDRADCYWEQIKIEESFQLYIDNLPTRHKGNIEPQLESTLGKFFLLQMLRLGLRMAGGIKYYEKPTLSPLLSHTLSYIGSQIDKLPRIVQIYFQTYQAVSDPGSMELFHVARENLQSFNSITFQLEQEELYTSILNSSIHQLNQGNLAFLPFSFETYVEMLEKKIIVLKGKLSIWHFGNLTNLALRLKKFDWTTVFIDQWQHKLAADYANNAGNFSQGLLAFHQQKYEKAEKYFNLVLQDFQSIDYGIVVRGYLIQTYYETGNTRGLESLSHSLRMYVNRKKEFSEVKRTQVINFLNLLNQLLNIPLMDLDKLEKFRKRLEEKERRGMGISWLMEKVAERPSKK